MQHYQRALITGASRGIGRAFARRMPAATDLLLTGRDEPRLDDEVLRLARPGRRVEKLACDLTLQEDRDRLIEAAEAFEIDLLVNNAGVGRLGPFLDSPPDVEQRTVLLNVVAVVDLTRRLLPGMLARARGKQRRAGLIVVASTAAFTPLPMLATYAASKAFDLQFTEALAEELRDEPVDVMALCPGATRTSFGERAGWRRGSLPCAADPNDVAADALESLGRQTVCVPGGGLRRAALSPVVAPRRLLTGVLGLAMRFAAERQ
jgi:short-subunit dehydrogenase